MLEGRRTCYGTKEESLGTYPSPEGAPRYGKEVTRRETNQPGKEGKASLKPEDGWSIERTAWEGHQGCAYI